MFGHHRHSRDDWEGWTPPWMREDWQGPRGPRGPFGPGFGPGPHFRRHFGPGWWGPRGFGFGWGWQGPQGPGQHWHGPSPEMQALASEAFEVARLFAIAGRGAFDNKDRQAQLHALLERTRKELSDMIYSSGSSEQAQSTSSEGGEPGVEQA
jgi:hypothetical protein